VARGLKITVVGPETLWEKLRVVWLPQKGNCSGKERRSFAGGQERVWKKQTEDGSKVEDETDPCAQIPGHPPGMAVLPALQRLRQKDHEFEASLGYIARPCLKEQKQPGVVAHAYNPSYSGGRVHGQPQAKVYKTSFQQTNGMVMHLWSQCH
jgi:hypothetical protein